MNISLHDVDTNTEPTCAVMNDSSQLQGGDQHRQCHEQNVISCPYVSTAHTRFTKALPSVPDVGFNIGIKGPADGVDGNVTAFARAARAKKRRPSSV